MIYMMVSDSPTSSPLAFLSKQVSDLAPLFFIHYKMATAILSFSSVPRTNQILTVNHYGFLLKVNNIIATQRNLHFQKTKPIRFSNFCVKVSNSNGTGDSSSNSVQELKVPTHWLHPDKASQESEWLRLTLHKWLDDEYCPEETNIEISKVAAGSFYESLMEKRVELGDILLKMALDLESISYQESFHGAFSSANAAVNLVMQRISSE